MSTWEHQLWPKEVSKQTAKLTTEDFVRLEGIRKDSSCIQDFQWRRMEMDRLHCHDESHWSGDVETRNEARQAEPATWTDGVELKHCCCSRARASVSATSRTKSDKLHISDLQAAAARNDISYMCTATGHRCWPVADEIQGGKAKTVGAALRAIFDVVGKRESCHPAEERQEILSSRHLHHNTAVQKSANQEDDHVHRPQWCARSWPTQGWNI